MATHRIRVTVNGTEHEAEVEPRLLLVHFLRDVLRLTGTHIGCETTHCGACAILLDRKPVKSCTLFAVQANGRDILTVEGLEQDGRLHPIQDGFWQEHGLQCGFCTPGMLGQSVPLHGVCQHCQIGTVCGGEGTAGRDSMTPRTAPEVGGMGRAVRRKEDPRFIRGQGTYVDDIERPGMLYLDIVRSPYAHANIKHIDASKALAIPGVLDVITGETLAKYNLHWMPTLMSDMQMVLPVEKVMYQGQEVAAALATDRYTAADGVDAVEVDYEPLPVVVDPFKALQPEAPVLRTDKPDKKDNHIFHWEVGDKAGADKAFREAEVTVRQDLYIPRIHVASIETCGCIAQFDRVSGQLTVWMTSQAPHAIRTVFALVAGHVGLAEHKIRIISPDLGGGWQGAGLPRLRHCRGGLGADGETGQVD